jgi:acetyl esterase/lipase
MYVKTVHLWEETPGAYQSVPTLDVYIPENRTSDIAVVILPGGAYTHHAVHEGKGYAEFLNAHGITAFVCPYRVNPHLFPLPLLDSRRAVRYVRYHSEEFGINKNKVYIMGSSAGGHLAALTSTYYKPIEFEGIDENDKESFRPDGQILCYPVIALLGKGLAHLYSGQQLLGMDQAEMGEELSPHLIADETAPRAFLWHTFEDNAVPVQNSLLMAHALAEHKVLTELHIFPHGKHGASLCSELTGEAHLIPEAQQWPELAARFLKDAM